MPRPKKEKKPKEQLKIVCRYCGKEFLSAFKKVYCSKKCSKDGRYAIFKENREAWRKSQPKTYKQIVAENRKRKVEEGWRGRQMQGSGISEKPKGIFGN